MLAVYLTYAIWPNPLSMHCAFWGTASGLVVAYICRGLGIKDDEETIKRQAEVRTFLDDIDAPSESGKQWRSVMKIAVPLLVLLCHWAGLYPGQQGFLLRRIHALVVLADLLVDSGYRDDVGPLLQG